MHRIHPYLLLAILVGVASDGIGLQHLGQGLEALIVPQIQALLPGLIDPHADLLDWPGPTGLGHAAVASLLTIALAMAFLHLSWWVGLLGLLAVSAAWCALTVAVASVPLGPLLLAGLVAYGIGLLARQPGRPGPGKQVDRPPGDRDELMAALGASDCAAILTFDHDGLVRSSNPAAEIMFGYGPKELPNTPFRQLLAGTGDGLQLPVHSQGAGCELKGRRSNGQGFDLAATFSSLDLGDGPVRVAMLQDITELLTEREVRSLHDEITGLPQDVLFADRVGQAILAAERASQPLALLIIHLKMLRMIRETLGDGFADRLLGEIVARLRGSLRRSDTLARLGDAEFGLLFPCPADAEAAGRKAQAIANQLNQPLVVDGLEAMLEVHIGLATYPQDGRTPQELQERAEVAMLAARRAQRSVAAYPEAAAMPISEELLLVDQLREAIEDCQLFLEFLPKLDLHTRQLDGVEALVRWQHPERGVILAERFINIAERYGLILPLTLRVIALATAQLRSWQDEGKSLSVAVNLSVELLQNPQFPIIFDHICAATGGRAKELLLEISERSLAEHPTTILHVAKVLKEKGCQLSLDNFGTGSLSLPLLQRLPIVELKVDRSFVTAMLGDETAAGVVRSAMSLGDSLGVRVVAVGVEDQTTMEALAELGCTQVQGHHIGAPMAAAAFREWLATFAETESGQALPEPDAA